MNLERLIFLLCVTTQICKYSTTCSQSWKQSQILESKRCIFKLNLFSYGYWGKTLSDNNFDKLVFIETTKFLELFFSTGCAWIHKTTNSHAHQILFCPHFKTRDFFFWKYYSCCRGRKGLLYDVGGEISMFWISCVMVLDTLSSSPKRSCLALIVAGQYRNKCSRVCLKGYFMMLEGRSVGSESSV